MPEPSDLDFFEIQSRIARHRSTARQSAIGLVKLIIEPGRSVAAKFDEQEMRWILAAYERIPSKDYNDIIPDLVYCEEDYDGGPPLNFAMTVATWLLQMTNVGSDTWFPLPLTLEESAKKDLAVDVLLELPPNESVALNILLEAARCVPVGTVRFENWWHPDILLRILSQPDIDFPVD